MNRLRVLLGLFFVVSCSVGSLADAEDFSGQMSVEINGVAHGTGLIVGPLKAPGATYTREFEGVTFDDLPDHYDSTELGLVPPIRDQGGCGSCWSFARTAMGEIAKALAGNAPLPSAVNLSEQDLVAHDDYGCGGGFMEADYESEKGFVLESKCPYTARNGGCNRTDADADTHLAGWSYVGNGGNPSEVELCAAINKYAAAYVTTAAGGSGYDTDSSGNFKSCNSTGINHMVILVGCEKRASKLWFKLRNSWSEDWGTMGYGWLTQGCNQTGKGSESVAVMWVDGPGPKPPITLVAPIEVITKPHVETVLAVQASNGITYSWNLGNGVSKTGSKIWVSDYNGAVTLTGQDESGKKVSQIVNVVLEAM